MNGDFGNLKFFERATAMSRKINERTQSPLWIVLNISDGGARGTIKRRICILLEDSYKI